MRTYTLFIAEDDEDDFEFVQIAFQQHSRQLKLVHFKNGEDLVQALQHSYLNHQLPDLVILDINMPKMDGLQALEKIRSGGLPKKLPVVIHTTSSCREQMKKSLLLGGNEFITKGCSISSYAAFAGKVLSLLNFK